MKDDDSSDDEEIKDLLKNINLSGKKSVISSKLRSASPLSSNASEDDTKYEAKKWFDDLIFLMYAHLEQFTTHQLNSLEIEIKDLTYSITIDFALKLISYESEVFLRGPLAEIYLPYKYIKTRKNETIFTTQVSI